MNMHIALLCLDVIVVREYSIYPSYAIKTSRPKAGKYCTGMLLHYCVFFASLVADDAAGLRTSCTANPPRISAKSAIAAAHKLFQT